MSLSNLILVRHANPVMDWTKPAAEWRLSDEGRRRAAALAANLPVQQPEIVHSLEPKAAETAVMLARHLKTTSKPAPGLHEHLRSSEAMQDRGAFIVRIEAFFEHPGDVVFGEESADAAHTRFNAALEQAIRAAHLPDLIVVTHGTVLSLWLSRRFGLEPFKLWEQLRLPCAFQLALPDYRMVGSMIEV